ncbi:MAG: hypothetical protein ACK4MV_02715 [Beijerinckiaceae bacterium]
MALFAPATGRRRPEDGKNGAQEACEEKRWREEGETGRIEASGPNVRQEGGEAPQSREENVRQESKRATGEEGSRGEGCAEGRRQESGERRASRVGRAGQGCEKAAGRQAPWAAPHFSRAPRGVTQHAKPRNARQENARQAGEPCSEACEKASREAIARDKGVRQDSPQPHRCAREPQARASGAA